MTKEWNYYCSRMFQDVPGCSRMIQDVPKIIWISAYKLSLSRMGMDASYMSGFCATMSGSVFMHRFRIVLGQCVLFIFYWTVALRSGNIFGLNTVRHFSDFFLTKVIQQQNNTTSIGPCFLGSYEIYMYFYYVVILLKVIKFRFRNHASVSIKKERMRPNKRKLHELPFTEIRKSGTILDSFFGGQPLVQNICRSPYSVHC